MYRNYWVRNLGICKQNFFGLDTGTVFYANNFYGFEQHSVFNSKQSVFYL